MNTKRDLTLDVIRGVLAWAIVFVHILWFAGLRESGSRAAVGWVAVELFMALAGYVAVATYRPEPYGRYLIKRVFRLGPVLIVCLGLSLLVRTTLTPAWFITLVAQFYLVFPGIMWAIKRYGRRVLLWLFMAGLIFRLPVIYGIMERHAAMGELLPMNLIWFAGGMCAFYLCDQYVLSDLSRKCERFWFLAWQGELSYSTYLIHWPVLAALSHLIPSGASLSLRILALCAMGLPAVSLAALWVHAFVELPGIELGRLLLPSRALPAKKEVYVTQP